MAKTLTAPEATTETPKELHGADLIKAILSRKLAVRVSERDAAKEELHKDHRIPELGERLAAFRAACEQDLAAWSSINIGLAERVGIAGLDVLRGIQERAASLRENLRHAQARLGAVPGQIDQMSIDDVENIRVGVQHEILLIAEIPHDLWVEFRGIADALKKWESEHVG